MSYFLKGAQLGYLDYLADEAQQLPVMIDAQTREIISSAEALLRQQIALQDNLREGFEILDFKLSGISELNARFDWGFSNILSQIGGMRDSLADLVKASKTPVQTVAFNHFEIARDAFRKGLYKEALEELDKAIAGSHISPGYKLEWRFHHLRAVIRLGFANCDTTLVNLADAESAFLSAARYAKTDFPMDAARSFLSAGWAAYCQGKMEESLAHTEQALTIDNHMGEAVFQTAKVLMAADRINDAFPFLKKAIDLDRLYALKAAGDGDFIKHEDALREFLISLRNEKYQIIFSKIKAAFDEVKDWRENTTEAAIDDDLLKLEKFISKGNSWPLIDLIEFGQTAEISISEIKKRASEFVSDYISQVKEALENVKEWRENASDASDNLALLELEEFVSGPDKKAWSIPQIQKLIPQYLIEINVKHKKYKKYIEEKRQIEAQRKKENEKKIYEDMKKKAIHLLDNPNITNWHLNCPGAFKNHAFVNLKQFIRGIKEWSIADIQKLVPEYISKVISAVEEYEREEKEKDIKIKKKKEVLNILVFLSFMLIAIFLISKACL